jgi:hypothetical protein
MCNFQDNCRKNAHRLLNLIHWEKKQRSSQKEMEGSIALRGVGRRYEPQLVRDEVI